MLHATSAALQFVSPKPLLNLVVVVVIVADVLLCLLLSYPVVRLLCLSCAQHRVMPCCSCFMESVVHAVPLILVLDCL
jgi:hypothetical protein